MEIKEVASKTARKIRNGLRKLGGGENESEKTGNISSDDLTQEVTENSEEMTELEEAEKRYAGLECDYVWAFIAGQYSQDFRGNPKYLFVYINRYRSDIKAYWLCSDEETVSQVRALGFTAHILGTPAAQYAIDHTGVLVTEQVKSDIPDGFEDVKYLNLWHGVGGFKHVERKKFDGDLALELARKYVEYGTFYRDHELLAVTSPTIETLMSSDLGVDDDKLIRTGYFRCMYQKYFDPVCSFEHNLRKIKGLSEETKMIVYAPTYRSEFGGTYAKAIEDLEALYQCCERNHLLFIFKVHPHMEEEVGFLSAKEIYGNRPYFWFWDNSDDFYEIMDQMDLVIYDYSSMFFDFVAAGVPHYIRYIYDYEEYMENGFSEWDYFEYTTGEICRNFSELLSAIDTYQEKNDTKDFQRINEEFWAYAGGKEDFEKVIRQVQNFQIEEREFPTLYSFDVFDTLISRKVLEPEGIFYAVRDRMEEEGGFPPVLVQQYPKIRQDAELNVREFYKKTKALRNSERVEITFSEIFARIADVYHLSDDQISLLEQWELQEEVDNVIPLTKQIDLVKQLKNRGETVVLICDMYLPKDSIKEMLYKADPVLTEIPLFLSNEYGVLKTSQKLFFEVYKSFEPFYDFKKWIHYGDTLKVDITPARKFNICPRVVAKPTLNEIQQSMVNYLGTGDSYLVAAMQARMCFNTSFKWDEFVISYIALTLVPYVDWALRDAADRGYKTLYFISRDGYHLKRIADEIIRARGLDFKTKYIYASRRTWRIPSFINEVDDNFWQDYGNFGDLTSKEKLFKAMDLDEETFREFFPTIDPDQIDFVDKEKFQSTVSIFRDSEPYNAYLLKTAAKERELVEEYLKQEIQFDESFAIVEYYGRGYTQDTMVRLCQDITGEKTQVPFYYMRTVLPTMGDSIRYNFSTNSTPPFFMESILANMPYKSIEKYERKDDGTVAPVIVPIEYDDVLFDSMCRILPEFAAGYVDLDLRCPEDTDHLLHEFAFDYYFENRENPSFAEKIGTLHDSVALYGTKREFAPPYTEQNLEQFANKEIKRNSTVITTSVSMSVTRSSEEIREKYFELYQILPGDNVKEGKILSEENLETNRNFKQKYEILQNESEIYRAAYDQAVLENSVQDKVVFVTTGETLKNSGLNLVQQVLQEQKRLESTTVSMKEPGDSPEQVAMELASARYILTSHPIAQFCKITFRNETSEIMLSDGAFPVYNKGLSSNYYLKWHTQYERLAGENDFSVLQIPSERLKDRYMRYYSRKSTTDCSLRGCCNTDVYYDDDEKTKAIHKLQDIFPESYDKKIILYMPKIRSREECPEWISMIDLEDLQKLIGDEYVVVVNFNSKQMKGKYYNVIEIPGFSKMINKGISLRELMMAADVIVGDYRDTFFESAILHKPVYFTAADYEQIIKSHNMDVANEFESYIFGPVVETADDLADELKKCADYDYSRMEEFRDEMFEYCDGNSVDRVVDYLISHN